MTQTIWTVSQWHEQYEQCHNDTNNMNSVTIPQTIWTVSQWHKQYEQCHNDTNNMNSVTMTQTIWAVSQWHKQYEQCHNDTKNINSVTTTQTIWTVSNLAVYVCSFHRVLFKQSMTTCRSAHRQLLVTTDNYHNPLLSLYSQGTEHSVPFTLQTAGDSQGLFGKDKLTVA